MENLCIFKMFSCRFLDINKRECVDPHKIWKAVLSDLEIDLSPVSFSAYIKPVRILSALNEEDGWGVELAVPSGFHQRIIEQRYAGQIKKVLEKHLHASANLRLVIQERDEQGGSTGPLFSADKREEVKTVERVKGDRRFLNPRLTFETLVVGSSNNFAHAAAQGVVNNPGRKYNPLFIYGGVGLGKTHLVHAIGHALLDKNPEYKIIYISAETFTNELISSLQSKSTTNFKRRYRTCDALLIDDIQFISGKEYSQEEFFHTFNELYMSERQIILTSDRPPQEIPEIEERLTSRFMGGLTVDIQSPDYEMRVGILTQKMKELGVEAERGVIELIADKEFTNVRELEGVFRRVAASAAAKGKGVSEELVQELLGLERKRRARVVRPSTVISRTAKYYNFSTTDLKGKSRKAPIATARHVAMYILKTELEAPYEKIGESLGGRDHTTVMHGVEKIGVAIKENPQVRRDVNTIKSMLTVSE